MTMIAPHLRSMARRQSLTLGWWLFSLYWCVDVSSRHDDEDNGGDDLVGLELISHRAHDGSLLDKRRSN